MKNRGFVKCSPDTCRGETGGAKGTLGRNCHQSAESRRGGWVTATRPPARDALYEGFPHRPGGGTWGRACPFLEAPERQPAGACCVRGDGLNRWGFTRCAVAHCPRTKQRAAPGANGSGPYLARHRWRGARVRVMRWIRTQQAQAYQTLATLQPWPRGAVAPA